MKFVLCTCLLGWLVSCSSSKSYNESSNSVGVSGLEKTSEVDSDAPFDSTYNDTGSWIEEPKK